MKPLALLLLLTASALSCSGGDSPAPSADGGGGSSGGAAGSGGGAGGAPGTASMPDPCTLLSVAEWTPLMDMAPTVEPRMGSAGPVSVTRCDWTAREGGTRRQFSNLALAGAGAFSASAVPGSMPIAIGDQGYISTVDLARTVDIGWKKGALSATFKYSALVLPAGKTWPEMRDAAVALARLAASRMP